MDRGRGPQRAFPPHHASFGTLVALTSRCHEAEEEENDRRRQGGAARGAKVRFSAGGNASDSGQEKEARETQEALVRNRGGLTASDFSGMRVLSHSSSESKNQEVQE